MIIETSIKIKNYKCFNGKEQGFERIYPINIVIGKNNSGKSSLIDLIEYLINPAQDLIETKKNAECIIGLTLSEEIIEEVIRHYSGALNVGANQWEGAIKQHVLNSKLANKYIWYRFLSDRGIEMVSTQLNYGQYKDSFYAVFKSFFEGKRFKRINAERDIVNEGVNDELKISSNGSGSTNTVRGIINKAIHNPDLILKDLLNAINEIVNPDIEFSDIYSRDIENGRWEIYFKDMAGNMIALSKMGSGIKTILLVLLNLIVLPELENIRKNTLVFGFEELENNLHPALQRRLFNYLMKYSEENGSCFFITTHSNIIIDLFSSHKNAQIIHVEKNGKDSTVKTVQTNLDGRSVLKDLDYKASDLLLSNGIIWVEGASDAIYLELFLDLYKSSIEEDLNNQSYVIQSLSTAIWKYAGFTDFDWEKVKDDIQNQIISLAKLNHNHLLIIDNDGNYDDKKPSDWNSFGNGTGINKAKLIHESIRYGGHNENELINNYGDTKDGRLFFWINEETIESYLKLFIEGRGKEKFEKYFEINGNGFLQKKKKGENSSKSKVELAAEIATFSLENNLTIADFAPDPSSLFVKIKGMFQTIKSWN